MEREQRGQVGISAEERAIRRKNIWRSIAVGVVAVLLNVLLLLVPFDAETLGSYGYVGIGVVALIGNATVLLPAPYPGAVALAAGSGLNLWGVAICGAIGSVIGESFAFLLGRAGKGTVSNTRMYQWVQRQLRNRWRAFAAIFVLSAIPNPAFDVAGITAGAMGLPYWLFFIPTLLGRIIKMLTFALFGMAVLD